MVRAAAVVLAILLTGCTSDQRDIAGRVALGSTWQEHKDQEAIAECAQTVPVEACRQFMADAVAQRVKAQPTAAARSADGQTVYDASECIGAVVNGECHGSILPNKAVHPVCHGEMLNGVCTGPMF